MAKLSAVVCTLFLVHITVGRIDVGTVSSNKNWVFITRFCFLGTADSGNGHVGRLSWNITHPQGKYENSTTLLLYDDDVWDLVYPGDGSWNCHNKTKLAMSVKHLNLANEFSGCRTERKNGQASLTCSAGTTFGTPNEKWWYMVLANCESSTGVTADYSMLMTNSQDDNIFFRHYSADEFFILQTDIGFLVVYTIMALLSLYVTLALIKLQLFHTTYKIYLLSLFIQFLALIVQVGYWSDYGLTGIPQDSTKYAGRFLEFVSTIVFVVLLILMAKGYTITRGRIRKIGVIKIIVLSALYCVITIAMFIWEATSFDPGQVLYIYDSVPGYFLIAVRILAWLWFCYGTVFTISKYTEKRSFYMPFVVMFSIWFWAGPIVAFAAIDGMPKWTREKVVNGVNLLVVFLGHLIFLILTWPNQANDNFPYHVKTSQITDGSQGDADRGDVYDTSNTTNVHNNNIFSIETNGTTKPVNVDQFPHETGDYVQERAVAMHKLHH